MIRKELINACWDVFDMTDASMGAVIDIVLEEAAKACSTIDLFGNPDAIEVINDCLATIRSLKGGGDDD